ncbi:DNA repair protein Rad51 homolog-like Protein [Tribolium castaneum]|uniref:DNA repair protein RAD51 homolog 3 n=1 Tax=Tribolium castaneum TaxID=7070 RepID=D6WWE2_TRICA|nr:PREDICTED: DNA repair protein RAD51 homolog 3 [Tribolium castaneum]EFA08701.2 DNA repair protein Rad51 homolog-like Protein [Tribolium castaneum]|eukprot:XP_973476.2 PREDICTED: DNA repair protein RAD51 homolog 3 [Tribolium castaneum]
MNQPISSLNLPDSIIGKLANLGFNYCNDLGENVAQRANIPDYGSLKRAPKRCTALELCESESNWKPVTSFIPQLDCLLSKEIASGVVTELCGLPGTGRTQICLHLAVGVAGETVFIHTNNNLSVERLKEIAEKFVPDVGALMQKLLCIEATNFTELRATVQFLKTWLSNNQIRLLIVDSIAWPLKQQPLMERPHLIYRLFQELRILANLHNFAIVVTNDLTTRNTGATSSSFGDSFYHIVNNRILLSRVNNRFCAKTLKSANKNSEVFFKFE